MDAATGFARMHAAWDSMRAANLERRLGRADDDRARLRTENRMLVEELDRAAEEREHLVDLLAAPARRRRALLVATGALGAAGWLAYRDREAEIRAFLRAARGKAFAARDEARTLGREAADEVEELAEEFREGTRRVREAPPAPMTRTA